MFPLAISLVPSSKNSAIFCSRIDAVLYTLYNGSPSLFNTLSPKIISFSKYELPLSVVYDSGDLPGI